MRTKKMKIIQIIKKKAKKRTSIKNTKTMKMTRNIRKKVAVRMGMRTSHPLMILTKRTLEMTNSNLSSFFKFIVSIISISNYPN